MADEICTAESNLSAVLHGQFDLRMENLTVPEPGSGEVQIAMHSCGVCGSDLQYWSKGEASGFKVTSPIVMGHEGSGVVTKIGEGVTRLQIGDRVALELSVSCRKCAYCKIGRYNLCPSSGRQLACLARYRVLGEDCCHKLPDNVSLEEGALAEPLAVAVYACRKAGVFAGSRILILGAGPIGLANMMAAKSMGAVEVCIADVVEYRLNMAKSLGATQTILFKSKDVSTLQSQILETVGELPDVTIECSGAPICIELGMLATKCGGCLMLLGRGVDRCDVPIITAAIREIDIKGTWRYCNSYPAAIAMIASGSVDMKAMVTHRFKLDQTEDAYKLFQSRDDQVMKVLVQCHNGMEF